MTDFAIKTTGSLAGLAAFDIVYAITLNGVTYTYGKITRQIDTVY